MLSDNNQVFGSVINILEDRFGTAQNDTSEDISLPAEGYLITATGANFVDASGNKFVWADRL